MLEILVKNFRLSLKLYLTT